MRNASAFIAEFAIVLMAGAAIALMATPGGDIADGTEEGHAEEPPAEGEK